MQLETATLTIEERPITVSSSDMPTTRALLRSISGINKAKGNTLSQSFVFNKPLEHSKTPAMDLPVTLLPKVSPASNVAQLLKGDNGAIKRASMFHQPLTDTMQCIPVEAVLPTAKPSQNLLNSSGAFALKGFAHSKVVVSTPVKFASVKEFIRRSNSDILNSQVNSNNLTGRIRRWNKLFQDKVKIEGLIPINKVSRTKFPRFIFKIGSLVSTKHKITFYPVPIAGKGAVARFDGAGSGIIADGSKVEVGLRTFSLKARFYRLSHLITSGTTKVCRKAEKLSGLVVNLMVQCNFIGKFLLPGNIANPFTSTSICLHCFKEKLIILRQKFYANCPRDFLHTHILDQYKQFVKKGGMCQFLCRLKATVSLTRFL